MNIETGFVCCNHIPVDTGCDEIPSYCVLYRTEVMGDTFQFSFCEKIPARLLSYCVTVTEIQSHSTAAP